MCVYIDIYFPIVEEKAYIPLHVYSLYRVVWWIEMDPCGSNDIGRRVCQSATPALPWTRPDSGNTTSEGTSGKHEWERERKEHIWIYTYFLACSDKRQSQTSLKRDPLDCTTAYAIVNMAKSTEKYVSAKIRNVILKIQWQKSARSLFGKGFLWRRNQHPI